MSDRVKVIVDGTVLEVTPGMAAMFKKLGEAHEQKQREMMKAWAEIFSDVKV